MASRDDVFAGKLRRQVVGTGGAGGQTRIVDFTSAALQANSSPSFAGIFKDLQDLNDEHVKNKREEQLLDVVSEYGHTLDQDTVNFQDGGDVEVYRQSQIGEIDRIAESITDVKVRNAFKLQSMTDLRRRYGALLESQYKITQERLLKTDTAEVVALQDERARLYESSLRSGGGELDAGIFGEIEEIDIDIQTKMGEIKRSNRIFNDPLYEKRYLDRAITLKSAADLEFAVDGMTTEETSKLMMDLKGQNFAAAGVPGVAELSPKARAAFAEGMTVYLQGYNKLRGETAKVAANSIRTDYLNMAQNISDLKREGRFGEAKQEHEDFSRRVNELSMKYPGLNLAEVTKGLLAIGDFDRDQVLADTETQLAESQLLILGSLLDAMPESEARGHRETISSLQSNRDSGLLSAKEFSAGISRIQTAVSRSRNALNLVRTAASKEVVIEHQMKTFGFMMDVVKTGPWAQNPQLELIEQTMRTAKDQLASGTGDPTTISSLMTKLNGQLKSFITKTEQYNNDIQAANSVWNGTSDNKKSDLEAFERQYRISPSSLIDLSRGVGSAPAHIDIDGVRSNLVLAGRVLRNLNRIYKHGAKSPSLNIAAETLSSPAGENSTPEEHEAAGLRMRQLVSLIDEVSNGDKALLHSQILRQMPDNVRRNVSTLRLMFESGKGNAEVSRSYAKTFLEGQSIGPASDTWEGEVTEVADDLPAAKRLFSQDWDQYPANFQAEFLRVAESVRTLSTQLSQSPKLVAEETWRILQARHKWTYSDFGMPEAGQQSDGGSSSRLSRAPVEAFYERHADKINDAAFKQIKEQADLSSGRIFSGLSPEQMQGIIKKERTELSGLTIDALDMGINVWLAPLTTNSGSGVIREYIAMGWNGTDFIPMPSKSGNAIIIDAAGLNQRFEAERKSKNIHRAGESMRSEASMRAVLEGRDRRAVRNE